VVSGFQKGQVNQASREVTLGDVCYQQSLYYVAGTQRIRIYALDITQRKGAETQSELLLSQVEQQRERAEALAQALQIERDTLDTIMENTRAHLAYLDPQLNFVRVNSAYAQGSGHTKEELLGRNHFDLFPNAENQAIFERVRDTGQAVEFRAKPFEYVDQPWRGVTYWDWTLVPVKDSQGRVQGLVLSLLDVTENVRAAQEREKALEESRQRQAEVSALLAGSRAVLEHREFQQAAQSIFDACKNLLGATGGYVALLSEDGTQNELVFLDSGHLPCTVDPSLPMPIRGLREQAYRASQAVYENSFPESEWNRLLPDGHVCLDNVLFAPLAIKGVVVGLIGLANKLGGFTDNDARLASAFGEMAAIALFNSRTLEMLENSEERFRSVAQTANDAIITIDSRGNIVFWNNAAETIYGYKADEMVGKPASLTMPERFRLAYQDGLARVVSTRQSDRAGRTVEMVGLRKDGSEFPAEISLAKWEMREEMFFTSIIRDITERKRAELTLRQAQEELTRRIQERTAMEERQRLARELHDSVSQALYGISLGTHTACALFDTDRAKALEALNYVLSLAQAGLAEMRALIFELRPESLAMEGLVTALGKQAAALRARHGIEVGLDLCDEPDAPLAIKEALYRIAQEALQNAIKHARSQRLDVRLMCNAESIRLEVCDNGAGFDPQASFPGHLGLRSMRERAMSVGGTLEIDSAPGCGTRIRAHIPIRAVELTPSP
jgi:PAS domain S-box-containing protein